MELSLAISIGSLISLFTGGVICFFGYRLYKLILLLNGFAFGFFATYAGCIGGGIEAGVSVLLAFAAGSILGCVFYFVHHIPIFIYGALPGLLMIGTASSDSAGIAGLIAAVLGGILALFLHRVVIILYTSFSGGLSVAIGGAWLSLSADHQYYVLNGYFNWLDDNVVTATLGIGLGLGLIGAIVQFTTSKHQSHRFNRERTENDSAASSGGEI